MKILSVSIPLEPQLIFVILLFLKATNGFAQLTLNQPNTSGTYTDPHSITLLPGFSTNGNFEAKIQVATALPIVQNPSQNQNYIVENKIRVSGITDPSQLQGLTANDLQQTITYYDGLGRLMQTVQTQASPDFQDIVTPIIYDPFGRVEKNYLPYAGTNTGDGGYKSNALIEISNFYNPAGGTNSQLPGGIPRIESPFGKTVFEASPLNRVYEQGAPGNIWQPAASRTSGINATGRTIVMDYATNTDQNGIRKVKLYKAVPTSANNHLRDLVDGGWYAMNQLYVNIIKDENWTPADERSGTHEEYVDKQGRTILKRSFNGQEVLSTYYVFDDFGNLCFVVPAIAEPDNGNIDPNKLADYCYQYFYDGRNRLIEKKIPGKAWEYLVYNQLDQLVMTQDGRQRAKSPQQWTISKYDALGRSVVTALYEYPGSSGGANIRQSMQDNVNGQISQWETRLSSGNGYTNVSWPTSWGTTLTISYYDNYDIPGLPSSYSYPSGSKMTQSLLTATRTKILNGSTGTNDMLWTVNYYDDKARMTKIFKQHFKNAVLADNNYDEISNSYDFIDQMLTSKRKHMVNGVQELTTEDEYLYDHAGRRTENWQSINGTNRTLLSKNTYNSVGQLIETGMHSTDGNNFAQRVTYKYNERGWMVSSEAPLFAMELQYANGATPQYNGNISGQLWGLPSSINKNYSYSYDKLNRLNSGISNENFDELLSYDKAGNILSLQRKRTGNELVDQLTYGYSNGNRLSTVSDVVSGSTLLPYQLPGISTYGYDENGNMVSRTNSGSTTRNISINYNLLNLPYQVSGAQSATYTYDAAGQKLRMVSGSSATDYINGINYNNGDLVFIQNETGRAVKNGNSFNYEYTINDHLGNARVSFDVFNGTARKIQENDYYPFGLPISRYASGTANKYLYNGKELQEEITMYDFGARFYDPVVARWNGIDGLAEKYYSSSPYNYVDNNPIIRIDPDGNDWIFSTSKDKDGNLVINLTYYTAVMNTSGKNIDMQKFMDNQVKEFENVFGQGNVNAKMLIREVKSADQLNDFESLIDIQAGNKFKTNEDGSKVGGDAQLGGKFLRLNADGIDKQGNLMDKKTLIHEIGHTGGLYHTFDAEMNSKFANGKPAPNTMQQFYNSSNSPYIEANFMNYSSQAAKAGTLGPSVNAIRFFNNTVGKASQGQVQTIVTNLYNGNLNYNNIPKKK